MIAVTEVTDPALIEEWMNATKLGIQIAGAPAGDAYLIVAAHGTKSSCLVLVNPDGTKTMWTLDGGTKDERKAKTQSAREIFLSRGGTMF